MTKVYVLILLVFCYAVFSFLVYTKGTESNITFTEQEKIVIAEGKKLYQENNCMSCHQVYGLGGYLGTDLTKAYSDKLRGEAYMRALLHSGGNRMPDFKFSKDQVNALMAYLKYVDQTAASVKY